MHFRRALQLTSVKVVTHILPFAKYEYALFRQTRGVLGHQMGPWTIPDFSPPPLFLFADGIKGPGTPWGPWKFPWTLLWPERPCVKACEVLLTETTDCL